MINRLNDPSGAIEPALLWMTLDETVVFPDDLEWGRVEPDAPGLSSSEKLVAVVADERHVGFVDLNGELVRVAAFPDDHSPNWQAAIDRTPAVILLRAPHDVATYRSFDDALHHAEVVVVPCLSATAGGASEQAG